MLVYQGDSTDIEATVARAGYAPRHVAYLDPLGHKELVRDAERSGPPMDAGNKVHDAVGNVRHDHRLSQQWGDLDGATTKVSPDCTVIAAPGNQQGCMEQTESFYPRVLIAPR